MMKIETVITDLDGTLLNNESKINPKTKKYLINLQKQGIHLVLASGRPTASMMPYALELELDKFDGMIISNNGACIVNVKTKQTVYRQAIPKEVSKRVLAHLKDFETLEMISDEEYMYVHDVYAGEISLADYYDGKLDRVNVIQHESRNSNYKLKEVEDLSIYVDFPVYKILVAGDPDYLLENHKKISDPFLEDINAVFSAPFYYEITAKNVDKGATIKNQLSKFGYNLSTTISFGDGHNDKSMLESVMYGVAMANAEDDVKEIADDITKTNEEDGVVNFLEEHLEILKD